MMDKKSIAETTAAALFDALSSTYDVHIGSPGPIRDALVSRIARTSKLMEFCDYKRRQHMPTPDGSIAPFLGFCDRELDRVERLVRRG